MRLLKRKTENYPGPGRSLSKSQPGYALLIVLAALAILLLLYSINIRAIFGPSIKAKAGARPQSRPWLEEDLILDTDRIIKLPRPPKCQFDEPLTLTIPVWREQDDRGEMTLNFSTEGEVAGAWSCQYSHEQQDYSFEATFAGNIAVEKTYYRKPPPRPFAPPQDPDHSMLYFIAKGDYAQTVYNNENNRIIGTAGLIYVTGWLKPDYSASGFITITTDKKWSVTYDWQTQP